MKSISENATKARELPPILRQYWMASVGLTLVALFVSRLRHTRLFMPSAHRFADLYVYQVIFQRYGKESFYQIVGTEGRWTYPDTMALFYRFYYSVPHPLFVFLSTVAVIVGLAAFFFIRELRKRGLSTWTSTAFVVTTLAVSYPLYFLVECANMELFLILFVGLGVICYLREKFWWAAAFLGFAAALKLFPVIYLGLFFSRRLYRQLLFGGGVGLGYYLLSHWIVGPTLMIALRGTNSGLGIYAMYYVFGIRWMELGFDHSLFTLVKHGYLVTEILFAPIKVRLTQLYMPYLVMAGGGAAALFFFKIRKMPPLNQVLALTLLALMLPPVSWDYRLVHLYVPWAFLVLYVLDHEGHVNQAVTSMLSLFTLLFAPLTYLFYLISKDGVIVNVSYGAQLKVVIMLITLYLAVRYPLGEEESSQRKQGVEAALAVAEAKAVAL